FPNSVSMRSFWKDLEDPAIKKIEIEAPMLAMSARKPYIGSATKLVVCFDIGTTWSGVSFSFLEPGLVPVTESVTKFPGRIQAGSTKIPTIIAYNADGTVATIGAKVNQDQTLGQIV
ncbi:hypothetical protein MPER_01898, partial [Moniliophthora perniciosa FA553]